MYNNIEDANGIEKLSYFVGDNNSTKPIKVDINIILGIDNCKNESIKIVTIINANVPSSDFSLTKIIC